MAVEREETVRSAPKRAAIPSGDRVPPTAKTDAWVKTRFSDLDERYQTMIEHALEAERRRADDANRDADNARKDAKARGRQTNYVIAALVFFVLLSFALVLERTINLSAGGFTGSTGGAETTQP